MDENDARYYKLLIVYEHAKAFMNGDEDGGPLSKAIEDFERECEYPDPE